MDLNHIPTFQTMEDGLVSYSNYVVLVLSIAGLLYRPSHKSRVTKSVCHSVFPLTFWPINECPNFLELENNCI